MAWIEYHTALRDHWKVDRLATLLNKEYVYALGAISCLWLWVAEYAQNGDISRFSDVEIRKFCRCNDQNFSKNALKECGLLNEDDRINDWNKYGIRVLKSSRKRQKEYRKQLHNANVTVRPSNLSILSNLSNNDTASHEVYDYYSKTIKSGAKEDAIKNISKLLKTGISKDDLLSRIDAYKKQLIAKPTDFIIQANNFFGVKARYKDFEPIKIIEYLPPDKDCRACKGQGRLQNGEGKIIKCSCVKEKK
jgi:hypothetical protein